MIVADDVNSVKILLLEGACGLKSVIRVKSGVLCTSKLLQVTSWL